VFRFSAAIDCCYPQIKSQIRSLLIKLNADLINVDANHLVCEQGHDELGRVEHAQYFVDQVLIVFLRIVRFEADERTMLFRRDVDREVIHLIKIKSQLITTSFIRKGRKVVPL
jgi:hypothetical protein